MTMKKLEFDVVAIQRAIWCMRKIRGTRTLRCLLPKGHAGPHQRAKHFDVVGSRPPRNPE